MSTARSF